MKIHVQLHSGCCTLKWILGITIKSQSSLCAGGVQRLSFAKTFSFHFTGRGSNCRALSSVTRGGSEGDPSPAWGGLTLAASQRGFQQGAAKRGAVPAAAGGTRGGRCRWPAAANPGERRLQARLAGRGTSGHAFLGLPVCVSVFLFCFFSSDSFTDFTPRMWGVNTHAGNWDRRDTGAVVHWG